MTERDEVAYWNGDAGERWAANADRIDVQLGPLGEAAMDRAGIGPGQRVLDVGCGSGGSTLEIARRVGPAGRAVGVDVSRPMLARARERARAAGLPQLAFVEADLLRDALSPDAAELDVAFSRFGVMFFEDPPAAFRRIRRALAPEGRLAFVCWAAREENPWMAEPQDAVGRHVELPPPPEPGRPGPFSLADPDRIRAILRGAGFADVECEARAGRLRIGLPVEPRDRDAAVESAVEAGLEIGPAAVALQGAEGEARRRGIEALRELFRRHATDDGVRLGYRAWIVTARAGGLP